MELRIPISEARARLPELAQRVMDAPGEKVIIEHRDRKERLVLTAESYVAMLEATVTELRSRMGGGFKLAGSLSTELSDAELTAALRVIKADAAAAAASKQQTLGE